MNNKTNPQNRGNEMEISNLLDKEFKAKIIKTLPGLWRRLYECSEKFNKDKILNN